MSDFEKKQQRVAEAEWIKRAAEVADTLTDVEIQSLGKRVRRNTGDWLRHVATDHVKGVDTANLAAAQWVMRLLLEEREYTLRGIQLGSRNREDG